MVMLAGFTGTVGRQNEFGQIVKSAMKNRLQNPFLKIFEILAVEHFYEFTMR